MRPIITATGIISNDAELITINGKNYAKFRIYYSTGRKNAEGKTENEFVGICSMAEKLTPYLKKGTVVFVQGNISTSAFQTKSGQIASDYTIWANTTEILKFADTNNANVAPQPQMQQTPNNNIGGQVNYGQYVQNTTPNAPTMMTQPAPQPQPMPAFTMGEEQDLPF